MGKGKKGKKGGGASASHATDKRVRQAIAKARKKTSKTGYHDSLSKDLMSIGLQIRNVRSDGNCLFGALADQLYGDQTRHPEVREVVVAHMTQHADDYRFFLEEDAVWEEYIRDMAAAGTWGGNVEIQAASMALHLNIIVHQADAALPRMAVRNWGPDPVTRKRPREVHLAYHGAEHYNSVRLRSDILPGTPALPFDVDALIESGGSDPGVRPADVQGMTGGGVAALSGSAKAAAASQGAAAHAQAVAAAAAAPDAASWGGADQAELFVLRNTPSFPEKGTAYVREVLRAVAGDTTAAVDLITTSVFTAGEGDGDEPAPAEPVPWQEVAGEAAASRGEGAPDAASVGSSTSSTAEAKRMTPAQRRKAKKEAALAKAAARAAARATAAPPPRRKKLSNKERRALLAEAKFEEKLAQAAAEGGDGSGPSQQVAAGDAYAQAVASAAASALQVGLGKPTRSVQRSATVDI